MAPRQGTQTARRPAFTSNTKVMVLLLAGGVIAAVAVLVVVLSSASFTASSKSASNALGAGRAELTVTSPNDPIVDAAQMKPNSVRSGDVTVTNTGERAIVSLEVKGTSLEPSLAAVLNLKIAKKSDGSVVPYNGPIAGAGHIDLGTFATGSGTTWTLTLSLPSTVDPAVGGKQIAADFDWGARTP
jgi:hypothetical protein